jgi:hypothetical protein
MDHLGNLICNIDAFENSFTCVPYKAPQFNQIHCLYFLKQIIPDKGSNPLSWNYLVLKIISLRTLYPN